MRVQPKISVVIPCFNHGEFVAEAVGSVVGGGRPDVEVIVVDDGSSDQRTRKEMDTLTVQGIHVIRQENRGLAAARNIAVLASKAPYILPLDADNHLRPAYIERGLQILDANPEVGVVYGDAEYIGTRSGRWRVGPFDLARLVQWNYIDACAIYRRAIWEQNGGYDGTMPVQGLEDWDFWLGAIEHGWAFRYVPEILFDYRTADDSMITRTRGFQAEIEKFIATKHAALYRKEFMQLAAEHASVKLTARNLRRLLKLRFQQKLRKNGKPD